MYPGACTVTLMTRVLERARTLSLAPSQSCYYPQGLAARSYVVNRLDTDLTTKLARCLRRRDDNRPTLSMTGTHTITNRRQNSLREAILPVFISCVPSCVFEKLRFRVGLVWTVDLTVGKILSAFFTTIYVFISSTHSSD